MLPDRTDALVGSMLGGDYRVLEPIAAGEIATVYLIEHQASRQRFAATVLSRELAANAEACARFTQGAHAASRLEHEHIVSILSFGVTVDRRPFFVTELLHGQTLDQRLAERPMAIEEVVAVGFPVARALAHAHARGIVHGDLKPENIILVQGHHGYFGVKVVDFGIVRPPLRASPARGRAQATVQVPDALGSSLFMAPEMCRGERFDLRADLYSFGILLHLMICGRLPFVDGQLRVLQMQLVELPARPRAVNSELSPELAAVVERALARHPDDRYPSMDALLRDLTAALPMGSDRLLIETGMVMRDMAFAPSGRHELPRTPRPSPPPPPGVVLASQPFAVSTSQPFVVPSSRPPAPARRRAVLVATTVVAGTLAAVLVLRQLAGAPPEAASGHDAITPASAAAAAPAPGADLPTTVATTVAVATPPAAGATPPPSPPAPVLPETADHAAAPGAAPGAAPDPAPIGTAAPPEAAADPAPASAAGGRPSAVAKRPAMRPKLLHPGKRIALATPTGARHDRTEPGSPRKDRTSPAGKLDPTGASTTSLAAGSAVAIASQGMDAEAGSGAAPPEAGRAGHPESGGAHEGTAGSPSPAVAADPGTLDATPMVVSLDVKGSLSPAVVRRSVERTLTSLRACYRTAARTGGATPAVDLRLTFEIDENSLATQIATGGASFGSLATCAATVASQIRTQEAPDVGTVQVAVVIRFRPS